MATLRSLLCTSLFAGAVASLPAAEPELKSVFVGVGERTTAFQKLNEQIVPTVAEPRFYLAEHAARGDKPPEWMVQWVASDLAARGYVANEAKLPSLWLVFEWGQVDPDVTHVGRPLQKLEARGRRIYEWRETKYERGEAKPFCVVTAYAIADAQKPVEARAPIWRTEMWTVLVRPKPQTKVEIGPLIFKEYGVAPKAPSPAPR